MKPVVKYYKEKRFQKRFSLKKRKKKTKVSAHSEVIFLLCCSCVIYFAKDEIPCCHRDKVISLSVCVSLSQSGINEQLSFLLVPFLLITYFILSLFFHFSFVSCFYTVVFIFKSPPSLSLSLFFSPIFVFFGKLIIRNQYRKDSLKLLSI